MDYAPVPITSHWESHVKHLVEHQVFNQVGRNCGRVQRPIDDNHSMTGVVVSKSCVRALQAPAQASYGKLPVKEPLVQTMKNLLQIVPTATCGKQTFGAALAPGLVNALANAGA